MPVIAVDTTTRSITVSLSGAVTTNQASWAATYLTPSNVHATETGVTDNAVAVTVVSSPEGVAGGVNQLLAFSLWNKDTVAMTVTVTYKDTTGSDHILQSLTLQTGESLTYEDKSGWSGLDVNGNTKVASNTVQVSTALSTALAASTAAAQASSMASGAIATNTAQSTSLSTISPIATAGSSQASSMHTALGNESTLSSAVSRLKASFGW